MTALFTDVFTHKYDELFQRFAAEFFGGLDVDWRWFRAQGIAESGLDPRAVSPVGAVGIMQLMPGTSAEMAVRLNLVDSPADSEFNIRCGIAYDRRCWDIWKQESGIERLSFMFASYNAGPGNIIKAQRLAIFKSKWSSVSTHLHKVTGPDDAQETNRYVRRIKKIYGWEMP
jgi:membrane-bound lytic murein transglycosylase F